MRFWILLLLMLMAGVGLAALLQADGGSVQIRWYHWQLQTSLLAFLGWTMLALVLLFALGRLLLGLLHLPSYLGQVRLSRRQELARQGLIKGLAGLAKGDFLDAERTLLRHVAHAPTPVIDYLLAAVAAHGQGERTRRQEHLAQARQSAPQAALAIDLLQARLLMADDAYAQALQSLATWPLDAPNPWLWRLRLRCLQALQDWSTIRDWLPGLARTGVVPTARWRIPAQHAVLAGLRAARKLRDLPALQAQWRDLPPALQQDEALVQAYADALNELGAAAQAGAVIEEYLAQRWSTPLVIDYGWLELPDPARRLQKVEQWRARHGHKAALALAVGCLYLQMQNGAQAEQALRDSLDLHPSAEAYAALARLHEWRDEPALACAAYRAALTQPALAEGDGQTMGAMTESS